MDGRAWTSTMRSVPLERLVGAAERAGQRLRIVGSGTGSPSLVRDGELIVGDQAGDLVAERYRGLLDPDRTQDLRSRLRLSRFVLRAGERDHLLDIAAEATAHVRRKLGDLAADDDPEVRDRGLRAAVTANHVHVAAAAVPAEPSGDLPIMIGCPVMIGSPVMHGTGAHPAKSAVRVPAPRRLNWTPKVTVAVLDTGLDPHPWFAGRHWLSEWGLTPERLDFDGDGQDRIAGHGTFVAGVVLQHAPGVTLRHRKVLSSLGFSDDLQVVEGLRMLRHTATRHRSHVDVVVLAAGCYASGDTCPPQLRREIDRFQEATVVAAAGNHGTDRPFWPAALPEVIGVGATGPDGGPAPFSNHGPWVSAAAPGVDVESSYVELQPDEVGQDLGGEDRVYGTASWSGTSFAAPQVAAAIATRLHEGHPARDAATLAMAAFPPPAADRPDLTAAARPAPPPVPPVPHIDHGVDA
jgi:hypothetical protein